MPKTHTKFVCQQCGYESAKWMGRCPDCNEWNTLVETVVAPVRPGGGKRDGASLALGGRADAIPLPLVRTISADRLSTGSPEFDRVLGGGVIPGSLTLLAGDPGIGKSTLAIQVAGHVALTTGDVLYVSAEESVQQVKLRAERLGIFTERLLLLPETEVEAAVETIARIKPALVIVDSVQTIASQQVSSAPGSISQVREATLQFMKLAKANAIPIFLIGHVTKEGTVAGPRVLEHIVDAVLYLEGERFHSYRLLRGAKNRFGATNEVGVFEMRGEGMVDVENPSAIFLADHHGHASGSAVAVSMEGTRPLLVEIQALVSTTAFGSPRYSTTGLDHNRIMMLVAVLTKRVGLMLGNHDVYANVTGGFTLSEPAVDFAVAAAVASSYREKRIPPDTVLIGEVGLGGELRGVTRMESRVREASKLGFKRCIAPMSGLSSSAAEGSTSGTGIEVVQVRSLGEALAVAME